MNISGILIQISPNYIDLIISQINEFQGCEYHVHDEMGKIVATIQAETTDEEINYLKKIQQLPHVISAEMVFSYSEDELENLRENIESQVIVPEWLNDPNIMAEQIEYHGDLKKKQFR